MQAINSILNHSQMEQQIENAQIQHFDTAPSHDDFLEQMFSTLPQPSCSWPDLSGAAAAMGGDARMHNDQFHFNQDQSAVLAAKLRPHQMGDGGSSAAAKTLLLQQQLLLQSRGVGGGGGGLPSPPGGSGASDSCLLPMPLSLCSGDDVINPGSDDSVQALYNGFAGSQTLNQGQHFHNPQGYGAAAAGGGTAGQPRQRVRARRGQATDPHSIAERLRRERIAERMKALQELVPNANKTDKASMLDEIIDYVKFLQLQVKVLSMSRLGGAAAVPLLAADMSSEASPGRGRSGNGTQTASTSNNNHNSNDSLTVTEHQVAKLMEEDMGSAMQYLQGKGLCLMPISLATAISTATCHSRNPLTNPLLGGADGVGPTSPSMSALTVNSGNGGTGTETFVKDAASVSKP